jgi:hypothetical protein
LIIYFRLWTKSRPEMPLQRRADSDPAYEQSNVSQGSKNARENSVKGLGWALYPAYSPDITPCDIWAFGTNKGMIKDRHLDGPEKILREIQEAWSHFTFEDFQNVLKSWIEGVTWGIATNMEFPHSKSCSSSSLISGLWDRTGVRHFFAAFYADFCFPSNEELLELSRCREWTWSHSSRNQQSWKSATVQESEYRSRLLSKESKTISHERQPLLGYIQA